MPEDEQLSAQLRSLQLSDQVVAAVTKPRSILKNGPNKIRKNVQFAPVVSIRPAARVGADHRIGERLPCCDGLGEHIMTPVACPSVRYVPKGHIDPLADGGVNSPWHSDDFWDTDSRVIRPEEGRRTFDVRSSNIVRMQFARPIGQ